MPFGRVTSPTETFAHGLDEKVSQRKMWNVPLQQSNLPLLPHRNSEGRKLKTLSKVAFGSVIISC